MAASEPTSWLFRGPHILVTLSMLFGALADDLGCFPFDYEPYHPQSHSLSSRNAIRSLIARANPPGPLELSVALPSSRNNKGCTSMHFGENQLLPNSISFSLLTTGHPRLFQQALVRSSMGFHPHFNLPMARSSGFGFIACNFTLCSNSLSLRLRNYHPLTSLRTMSRRLIFQ